MRNLSWEANDLLAEIKDRRSLSDASAAEGWGKSAVNALADKGLIHSENYANGRFWMLTEAGSVFPIR